MLTRRHLLQVGALGLAGALREMSTGDRDLAWTNVLGTLKIKVVEVKSRR